MTDKSISITTLSVEEREEILVDAARMLESTARQALVQGNRHFAALSTNMAEAIRINADELAREDAQNAERVLQQANAMISQFNAFHPYKVLSCALH